MLNLFIYDNIFPFAFPRVCLLPMHKDATKSIKYIKKELIRKQTTSKDNYADGGKL
jgi:hypothetical protein